MKILTSSFFNQYAQYAYQMIAENILNLNLTSEHMICYKKLCIWSTFIFFVYEKILTGQLRRAPAARLCNFSTKKFHQQVPLDAKGKVIRCQVSTTTHTAAGRDQRRSGLIQPPPALIGLRESLSFINEQLGSVRDYNEIKWRENSYVCNEGVKQNCRRKAHS